MTEGHLFPVTCGAATRNLGASTACSTFVDDLPSPAKRGKTDVDGVEPEPDESKDMVAFVFKTLADPYAGRVNLFRVYQGVLKHDTQVHNCRAHVKERIGQCCSCRRARRPSTPTSSARATSAPWRS